jgi:nitrate reductase gamma subunit
MIFYISIAVLVIGTLIKTIKIIKMPIHLRWELYPVPHEKGKGHYGGSYYEESDWWTKPVKRSLWGELKEVAFEIFAIKSLYRNNRNLWYFSYPFHIGLYLLTGFITMLVLGAILNLNGFEISASSSSLLGKGLYSATILIGILGLIVGVFGVAGLLVIRIVKSEYRQFSTRADYFNLILLLSICLCGFYAWITADRSFSLLREFIKELLVFKSGLIIPASIKLELLLTAVFFFYLPFTHMTHFVGKFFTYHRVRWQDEPNIKGSKTEAAIINELGSRVSWHAKHIKPGKSWLEGASGEDK